MVNGHYGTVVDGVFTSVNGARGFAASSPVPITLLSRSTVVAITLTGKSTFFSAAIASTNALNDNVHLYNENHHAAFHYSSLFGRVNSNYVRTNGTFAVHYVPEGGSFTAVLALRGSDRTVSLEVNGVPQNGAWALPTTDAFYLMLAAGSGSNIAVTDVSVTTADLA